jgi:Na+/H+-dicarboxylate symporter
MENENKEKMVKEKKKLGLSTKIFIALLTGAVAGVLIHYFMPDSSFKNDILMNGILYVLGNGFIRLMQMLVVPLVFCSLVCGSMAIGDTKTLGKVGIKTIIFYILTTALAISLALGVASLINPGVGMDITVTEGTTTSATASINFAETLLNIIPKNIFESLATGDMLPVIVFALFVGIMLAKLGNKASTVANFFSQFNDVMMEMTMAIMKAAPIGVFCLIAKTFAGIGFDAFVPMLKYMISVILALALQCFGVYQILLFIFTRLNPFKFIKKFFPVMAFAFSTSTSNATIPMSVDTLSKKIGVSKRISSFTIPLGATINMDGTSIMQGVAVIFIAQAYGMTLTPSAILTVIATATIASIGTAGVPSVGLVTLSMVLSSVGLPTEGIALIMGIDRILDMLRTAVNITGDAVCTTIIAKLEGAFNKEIFDKDFKEETAK